MPGSDVAVHPNQQLIYSGLNFHTLRLALCAMYWWKNGDTTGEWINNMKYVIPMQHNWENPINAESTDTYIQYWINRDDRLTQDYFDGEKGEQETARKIADIKVRFMGTQGEQWAKAFHHITQRNSVPQIFMDFCGAQTLEYVGPIVPTNVNYFQVGNTSVAFDLTFRLEYKEVLDLSDLRQRLMYVSIGSGELLEGGFTG